MVLFLLQHKYSKNNDGFFYFLFFLYFINNLFCFNKIDNSYNKGKPAEFRCNQVIQGMTDALTHMPVGSTWEIYIPQELAYGYRQQGDIKPFSALIFTIELLEILK